MKKLLVLLVLFVAAASNGDLIVDDFESYTSNAALQAAWVPNTGSDITTETLQTFLNGKCMLITNAAQNVGWTQTKLALPGSVHNVHGVNLSYLGGTGMKMTFAIPVNGGTGPYDGLGGSGGDVFISLYNCWGEKVWSASYAGSVTPSGTGYPNGMLWETSFSTGMVAGKNLENVEIITIGYDNGWYGAGCMLVDDVIVVGAIPEPATMFILGLGGLLLRRRK